MTARFGAVCASVALLAAVILTGCSDSKRGFTLKGSVSYQGKPLSNGMVRLHMAENRVAMAMIKPDGTFEITDVLPGEAKATVLADKNTAAMVFGGKAGGAKQPPLPAKYKDANTTDLVYTLKAGMPLNIELK